MLMIINVASAQTNERNIDWDLVSENLVIGIESGNPGVQQAAMRLALQRIHTPGSDPAESDA